MDLLPLLYVEFDEARLGQTVLMRNGSVGIVVVAIECGLIGLSISYLICWAVGVEYATCVASLQESH